MAVVALAAPAAGDAVSLGLPRWRAGAQAVTAGQDVYIFGGWDGDRLLSDILRFDPVTQTVTPTGASLPYGRYQMSAVWTGQRVYLFGGFGVTTAGDPTMVDEIVEFTPSTNSVRVVGARMRAGESSSAVWTGSHAYIFGGKYWSQTSCDVHRYDPATDTLTRLGAVLPTNCAAAAAAWDGQYAYLLGGHGGRVSAPSAQIVRYDPALDVAVVMPAALPLGRTYATAAWDGRRVYLFGGYNGTGPMDQIVRYTPATNLVDLVPAALPTGRYYSAATWADGAAYVFGGHDRAFLSQIVRFDPATNAVSPLSGTLPSRRTSTSAVWAGDAAYIFGGSDGRNYLDQIVRYDSRAHTSRVESATLPTPRVSTSAVWDGQRAFVFGGYQSGNAVLGSSLDQIVEFAPATGRVAVAESALPSPRHSTSAVWDGERAYIFGGIGLASSGRVELDEIVQYTPATRTVTVLPTRLPSPRYGTSAIWDGRYAYIFGGDGMTLPLDEVVRFDPATGRVDRMAGALPGKRSATSAVYANGHALVFAGYDSSTWERTYYDEAVRYDPPGDASEVMPTRLPLMLVGASSVWDGQRALIFGGNTWVNAVLEYQP